MRVPRIYHPEPLTVGQSVVLTADAFQHTIKVLRLKAADPIELFCGDGNNYAAKLIDVSKRQASVAIEAVEGNASESPLSIHLGQVISRGDRMDFALQKSVELGVSQITPLFSQRCGVKLSGERLTKKQAHWQKIVVSACEQCGRSRVPTVNLAQSLDDFVAANDSQLKLTLDPMAQVPLAELAKQSASNHNVALLIGPEGGFTDAEVTQATEHDFKPIRLGPRILRTETAALTALSVIQYQLGDLA